MRIPCLLAAVVLSAVLGAVLSAAGTHAWRISLDGPWNVTNANGSISAAAVVPGQIHLDLFADGIIGDPFYRFNDVLYQWIAMDNWTYTREFEVSHAQLNGPTAIFLRADGLDTIASLSVNGEFLAQTTNSFIRNWIPLPVSMLVAGTNSIAVAFSSTVEVAASLYQGYPKPEGGVGIPPQCPPPEENGYCHANMVRAAQASFGWDFAGAYAPVGIAKSISIESQAVRVNDITIEQWSMTTPPTEGGSWGLAANAYVWTDASNTARSCRANLAFGGVTVASAEGSLASGSGAQQVLLDFGTVAGLALWWPNGLGGQPLYALSVECGPSNNKTIKIGFRTIELIQDPLPDGGRTFYFSVNGIAVFLKGANWVPADAFQPRVTGEYVAWLFDSYLAASYNVLRVWGGGIYQDDAFYSLADERGLLIWQEAMFACAMYPTDPGFLDSVAAEITDNVLRIQAHPSLMLLSGSNENEVAIADNWYATANDTAVYVDLFVQLYWQTVLPIFEALNPAGIRLGSSPSNGNETAAAPIAPNPNNVLMGDVHFYNYIADGWNVSSFPSPRFASEFGYQSYPSLLTFAEYSSEALGDWASDSPFTIHRNHHPGGPQQIAQQMSYHFDPPSNGSSPAEGYDNYLFMTQVVQALCMRAEAEHYRRSQSPEFGTLTYGTLYWQALDFWPGASWSSIEFGGRWKVLHYYAVQFYAPLLISPYTLTGAEMLAVAVNDGREPVAGTLTVAMWAWDAAEPLGQFDMPFQAAARAATMVWNTSMADALSAGGCPAAVDCFATLSLSDSSDRVLASNVFYLASFSNVTTMRDPQLAIVAVTQRSDRRFAVELSLEYPAAFCWLETNVPGRFETNGGVVLPPSASIEFHARHSGVTIGQLTDSLVVSSFWDRYDL